MLSPMLLLALCILAVVIAGSIRRIPEGQVYTLRRLGGHTRLLGAGTHVVLPLVERVAHKISLVGSTLTLDPMVADGRRCRAALYYQVLDPELADGVIEGVEDLLRARTAELVRHPALPTEPAERRSWLKQTLNAELRERGLLVTRVDLAALD